MLKKRKWGFEFFWNCWTILLSVCQEAEATQIILTDNLILKIISLILNNWKGNKRILTYHGSSNPRRYLLLIALGLLKFRSLEKGPCGSELKSPGWWLVLRPQSSTHNSEGWSYLVGVGVWAQGGERVQDMDLRKWQAGTVFSEGLPQWGWFQKDCKLDSAAATRNDARVKKHG